MKKVMIGALGLATIAAGFVLLSGFRGHGGCGSHRDPAHMHKMIAAHIDDVLDEVKATPEQRARITAIRDRLLAEGKALHAERDVHQELLAQWDAPSPDMARINGLIDQHGDALKAFVHHVADGLAEVHAVLTPEQRAQISKKIHRRVDE